MSLRRILLQCAKLTRCDSFLTRYLRTLYKLPPTDSCQVFSCLSPCDCHQFFETPRVSLAYASKNGRRPTPAARVSDWTGSVAGEQDRGRFTSCRIMYFCPGHRREPVRRTHAWRDMRRVGHCRCELGGPTGVATTPERRPGWCRSTGFADSNRVAFAIIHLPAPKAGVGGNRTLYLLIISQLLSQLSYVPSVDVSIIKRYTPCNGSVGAPGRHQNLRHCSITIYVRLFDAQPAQ